MTAYGPVVAATLASTCFFAVATALKHRSARGSHPAADVEAQKVRHFLVATTRDSWWLGGLAADVGGLALQLYALHIGPLALVQPLMVTGLLFSFFLNHWIAGSRITTAELGLALLLILALVGFIIVSGAASPSTTGPAQLADRGPATAAAAVAAAVAVGCVFLARRLTRGPRAALIGVAVGVTYACTAALIKSCTIIVLRGLPALLTSWQLYALIVTGVAGLALNQLAFQAGPLHASLPAIATVDPLLSVALGVLVYDERLRSGAGAWIAEAACLAALAAAALFLSRVPQESPRSSSLEHSQT